MSRMSPARLLAGPLLLLAAVPAAAQDQPAADPAELSEAQAIVAVTFPPDQRDQTMRQMLTDIATQFRAAMPPTLFQVPEMQAIFDRHMDGLADRLMPLVQQHMPVLMEATAVAMTNEYSLEELREVRAFAETPVGRHYFEAAPRLLGDPAVAAVNTRYFAALNGVQQQFGADLASDLQAYVQQHPEVQQRLQGTSPTPQG